jgi:adenylate cyclase
MNIAFLAFLSIMVTALVYDRNKAELTAQALELNRRAASDTAARVEKALDRARADALTLLELNEGSLRGNVASGPGQPGNAGFFDLHPDFAALVSLSGGRLKNKAFFLQHNLDENAPELYLDAERELARRAAFTERQASLLLGNASPYFKVPVIVLFFRDRRNSVFAAFFSADAFITLLDGGPEKVCLVNGRDDIILHTDPNLMTGGKNLWREPLVRLMRNSAAASMDTVFDHDGGGSYMGAFRRLKTEGADAAVLCETTRDHVLGSLVRAIRTVIFLCGAAGGFAVIFSFALSFSIKRYLYNTFLEQEEEIVESQRLKSIFRALPAGLDTAEPGKVPLDGENRDVTVVFAGLCGKGALKDLSPQMALRLLNDAIMLVQDSFARTGGSAYKLSGDSLTGVWGAPFSDGGPEMDALNAVRGALMLRAALVKRGGLPPAAAEAGRRLTVGCGINSGVMLAGRLGTEEDSVYTLTGGAAGRARLIQSLNRRYGTDILISESAMELAGKYFITEEMPPVRVRGSQNPIRVFAVINVKVTKNGVGQPKPTNMDELRQMLKTARV